MIIGHYQCKCVQGDFEANLKTVLHGLELASEGRLDIVSFPESFLTGYFASGEDARVNSLALDSTEMKEVMKRTARFDTLFMVGFNERRNGDLYNTIAVIESGRMLGRYSKAFPCHDYFTPGREFPVFEKNGLKFGVIICADGGYVEPCRILSLKRARLIFAPHYNYISDPIQHYQMVRNDHVARAVENGIYFLRGNNVVTKGENVEGMGDGPHYGYGDSYLINPNGEIVAGAGLYDEYLMIYNLDLSKTYRSVHNRKSLRSAAALLEIFTRSVNEAARKGEPG